MHIRPFHAHDEAAVLLLWQVCGLTRPWNDPKKDIVRKLAHSPHMFLVGETNTELIASVMVGYDGHRGWINYLAVHPKHQRQGLAKALMLAAEHLLLPMGCPKINLQIRPENAAVQAFYQDLGYGKEGVLSMGKRLIDDTPHQ
jgi:ribosomal protein S18 acetylase RimI-like enzyme